MTNALKQKELQQHAWLEKLEVSPHEAVSDLMSGYAAVFPYTRADAPDAARMLFGHLPVNNPAHGALESGVLSWLESKRSENIPLDPARLQDFVRQVGEVFEIISLIKLVKPALLLRKQYVRWLGWASRLNLVPSRDARASYFRMLANTQSIVAEHLNESDALAPFWLRVCKEAGSTYPKSYLQIGLLGLRRLPGAVERGDSPWIAGLAAWAKENSPSNKEFMRAWLPIKRLHPASPKVLKKRVFDVLSQKMFFDNDIISPGWWASDPDFPNTQDAKRRAHLLEPPSPDLRNNIVVDLRNKVPFADVRERLGLLVDRYENYTAISGDDYFLVRSFCNVGNLLLKNSIDSHFDRAQFAEELARKTLRYQPHNPIAWGLWRDALFSGGAYEASIALGWETILRFPNDMQMRNELAEILIALEQTGDAQNLLEEMVNIHEPDNITYSILSRLYANFGNEDSARQAINAGLFLDPEDQNLQRELKCLDDGIPLPLIAKARRRVIDAVDIDAQDNTLFELRRSGKLRNLRQKLRSDNAAIKELKEILTSDPTFAYAQILAARHKIWLVSEYELPIVAASFEDALANEDIEKLKSLAERMPRLQSLILIAQAILGDNSAAEEVANLLRNPSNIDNEIAIDILRTRFQPAFELIEGGLEPADAVLKCADRLRIAIYDTNEVLSALELMAA